MQICRRKEIIKIKAAINGIENRKLIEKINESKAWVFEKINNIYKLLYKLTKKKIKKAKITNRNEKEVSLLISWILKG